MGRWVEVVRVGAPLRALAGLACIVVAAGCGSGASSGAGAGAPAAPSWITAIGGDASVSVAWAHSAGAQSYTLYWSTDANVDVASAARVDDATSPFVHPGLVNDEDYFYVVTASDEDGESAPSDEISATPSASSSLYDPSWAGVASSTTLSFDYDGLLSSQQNGANLKAAIQALQPGDRLEIGTGTYSVNSYFAIDLQGTAQAPIWIVAKSGATPVITRPDASQNALNVGASSMTRFVCLRGLEITGGDAGIRLYSVQDFWLDRCHVHHTSEAGITANTADTARLHLTRNEVDHTAGTGEGMYLGANNGQHVMRDSVIALNHVHHTSGTQGDGIEIKQGSFGNWIAENLVHDCNYPCILLYGTGGNPFNLVERNVCWSSGDNVMQVQGEAIVRNNLLIDGNNGFNSHDHQGQVRDLTFVHNTIVNAGRGAQLSNWAGRPNMVFANNVVYSQNGPAISFGGSTGVTISGNVVVGAVQGASSGWSIGVGLSDFTAVAWDGSQRDASLAAGSAILASGDVTWQALDDITGAARVGTVEAGCYDGP